MKWTHVAVLATAGPNDTLSSEEQPRPLLPGGRWLFDLLVPAIEKAGFHVPAVMPTSSGYWVLSLRGSRRRFDLVVSDIRPIYVCEVVETRTLGEWLRRSARDPQVATAFKAICDAIRSDARVRDVLTFSGTKKDGDAFVGQAIEKLERALGIYSR
jgi:hypothetical protein